MLYPGDDFIVEITTHYADTGGLANADEISAILKRNGFSTTETVTITNTGTGLYTVSAVIPEDWERGDNVWFLVTATVLNITGNHVVGFTVLNEPPAPVVIPPGEPGFVTGYLQCYDLNGLPKQGALVEFQIVTPPTLSGLSFDTNIKVIESNAQGIASYPKMVPTAKYRVRGGITKEWITVTIPENTDPVALDALLRRDP